MKTLRNFIARPFINNGGQEAIEGDQVRLFLDQDANPEFPEYIDGIIQHPVVPVECDSAKSYSIEYDEATLDGAANFIHADDVLDYELITQVDTIASGLDAEIAARIAADNLKANIASPTFTGNPIAPTPTVGDNDTSIATTAFVNANSNRYLNATQGIYQKIVISGAAGSEIITIQNY